MIKSFQDYSQRLQSLLATMDWEPVERLCLAMLDCYQQGKHVFICGNGGSAGNAIHLANDFIYGAGGVKVEALSANPAVITCLANDIGYSEIYSQQLRVKASAGDLLIVLSGSGNSENITRAIDVGNELGMCTAAILGYDGGKSKAMVDIAVHADINDMQISEDIQVIVGHMMMQWFCQNNKQEQN